MNGWRRLYHPRIAFVGAACWLMSAGAAWAHSPWKQLGEFHEGLLHPLFDLEHVALLLGTALLAAQGGRGRARSYLAWVLGGGTAAWLLTSTGIWNWDPGPRPVVPALLLLVAGGLAAVARPVPDRIPHALGMIAAGWVVLATGSEVSAETSPWVRGGGAVVTVGYLSLLGTAASARGLRTWTWAPLALRVAGSWIGALGLLLLALRI